MAWVKATSNTWNTWVNPIYAYDNDTGTTAMHSIAGKSWTTNYLELFRASISCSKVRIWTTIESAWITEIEVDVQYGAAWHNIYSGGIGALGDYVEREIGSTQDVTGMRVRYYNNHNSQSYMVYCHETDFWVVEAVEWLAGVVNGVAGVTGIVKPTRRVAGIAVGVAAVSGISKVSKKIAGVVTCIGTTAGLAKITKKIAGLSSGIASVLGDLTVTGGEVIEYLAGVVSGVASVTGFVKCLKPIAGLTVGISSVSGVAKISKKLSGVIGGIANVTGLTKVSRKLAGVVSGIAAVSGVAKVSKKIAGAIVGVATVAGELTITAGEILLAGVVSGVASVTGAIKISKKLAGTVACTGTITGLVRIAKKVAGMVSGVATIIGDLIIHISFIPIANPGIVDCSTKITVNALTQQFAIADISVKTSIREVKA